MSLSKSSWIRFASKQVLSSKWYSSNQPPDQIWQMVFVLCVGGHARNEVIDFLGSLYFWF